MARWSSRATRCVSASPGTTLCRQRRSSRIPRSRLCRSTARRAFAPTSTTSSTSSRCPGTCPEARPGRAGIPSAAMTDLRPQDRMPQRIAVVPGDGIGKDVTVEAVKVLRAAAERFALPIELEPFPWSADHYLATGVTLPPDQLARWSADYAAIFMGAFGDPRVPDNRHAADILLGTRFGLDLYVNFRPVKVYDQRLCPLKDKTPEQIDFVVFRENTEGAYVSVGGTFKKGTTEEVAVQEEIHTRKGVERIIRAAFEYATLHGKRRVCMSDKSNVMQHAHGLWQRV